MSSAPRPTGNIDAGWFRKRKVKNRARGKLAKASRKKNRS